ncbi:MAG: cysteinyl-tRNA synthetase [Thermotogota bacterium]|nr:cysteinyl-tRNA synthetase [Thermotogota bacterium]MDK2864837.1 cysteinyl-tRNA synthetase [Thermotogota bacterium]HCZ06976.1 cysteine--tRNA ligase [Thermotogota bacterium]
MLRITNTHTGKKEPFIPLEEGKVRMYVCGPTVYGLIHLGNARPAVVFDAFRRYLEYRGFKVTMVQNFTDIDDKIINAANAVGVDYKRYADRFIAEYWVDAHLLGLRAANFHPRTTDYLPEIIDIIQRLIVKGHAYVADGDVYFSVKSFPRYGELSNRKIEEMLSGARVDPSENKRFPLDFALWKAAKPGEPSWESPWGNGRPGWHIECSAMSMSLLGESFDIHAGGNDLVFPHHENEKAQSEALTGKPFARYWMHNGMLRFSGEKMAKSVGNIFNAREAVMRFGRDAVRLFLLSKHYTSPIDLSEEFLQDSRKAARRVRDTLKRAQNAGIAEKFVKADPWVMEVESRFEEALDDDFNTPVAVSLIFELVNILNTALDNNDEERAARAYDLIVRRFGPVLGLFDLQEEERKRADEENLFDSVMNVILDTRNHLRKQKQYELADQIRDKLEKLGIKLMDTPQGTQFTLDADG